MKKKETKAKAKGKYARKTRKNKCPIYLMTISTKKHPDMERFVKSAEAHGFKPNVLGLKENKTVGHSKAKLTMKGYQGDFGFKLKYILDFCKKRNPNDIILYTDCWDVIIVGDCDDLLKKYKAFHKDIVFSGDKTCFSQPMSFYKFNWYTDTFPYLNAGVMIGKAGTIISLIEKYWKQDEFTDDQYLWQTVYLENKDKIGLDTEVTMFLTTASTKMKDYVYENNKLKYLETNTFPSIVHAPGYESLGFKNYLKIIKY